VRLAASADIGRARRVEDARGRYVHAVKSSFPEHLRLDGLRIVVDCAHGAAYEVAPSALWELGADVISIGVSPNGININDKCGSTDTKALQDKVRETRADIGIALDGDADRLIIVDDHAKVVDGDQLMALVATGAQGRGELRGGGIVATVMSNLGLERFLAGHDLRLHRTQVGDRYVVEAMRAAGFNIGGEQSGHIVMTDHATTGDGLIAALQVLARLVESGKPAHELLHLFDPLPQLLKNVRFAGGEPLRDDKVLAAISDAERKLDGTGRLVIRKSGTEPLIRVMAEGEDPKLVETMVNQICEAVRKAA